MNSTIIDSKPSDNQLKYSEALLKILARFIRYLRYSKKYGVIYIYSKDLNINTIIQDMSNICQKYKVPDISIPIFANNCINIYTINFNRIYSGYIDFSKQNITFSSYKINENHGLNQFENIKMIVEYLNIDKRHDYILNKYPSGSFYFLKNSFCFPNNYLLLIKLDDIYSRIEFGLRFMTVRFKTLEEFYDGLCHILVYYKRLNLNMPFLSELKNEINAIITLCCIREYYEDSLIGKDYLPLDMFRILLSEFK